MICIHVWIRAKSSRNYRARRVRASLISGNLTRINELLNIAVVMSNADQRAMMEQVNARVTNMSNGHLIALNEDSRGSGAHARFANTLCRSINNFLVSSLNCSAKTDIVCGTWCLFGNNLNSNGACYLTGGVTSHTIADGKKGSAQKERVLVMLAN